MKALPQEELLAGVGGLGRRRVGQSNDSVSDKAALNSARTRRPVANKAAKTLLQSGMHNVITESKYEQARATLDHSIAKADGMIIGVSISTFDSTVKYLIKNAGGSVIQLPTGIIATVRADAKKDAITVSMSHQAAVKPTRTAWRSFLAGVTNTFGVMPAWRRAPTVDQSFKTLNADLARAIKDAKARG